MTKNTDKIIDELIEKKIPDYSNEDKVLAKKQLEDFLDVISGIIINHRDEDFEDE